jgi:hypothetical protein
MSPGPPPRVPQTRGCVGKPGERGVLFSRLKMLTTQQTVTTLTHTTVEHNPTGAKQPSTGRTHTKSHTYVVYIYSTRMSTRYMYGVVTLVFIYYNEDPTSARTRLRGD